MSRYAEETAVAPEKSRAEIERTLERYGATGFYYGSQTEPCLQAIIGFKAHGKLVRLTLPIPAYEFYRKTSQGNYRTPAAQKVAHEQAVRTRWRCLALAVKAKLEVVASGISTFEEEFLAHVLTYDGKTVGEAIIPKLEESYAKGKNVPLLLGAT